MTLNDLERRNSPYFAFSTEFDSFAGQLRHSGTVVEDRRIMSAKYCLPVPVVHFRPKLTHPAVRSLCDSWATCSICDGSGRVGSLSWWIGLGPVMKNWPTDNFVRDTISQLKFTVDSVHSASYEHNTLWWIQSSY